jgi:hypothetical protein
MTILLFQIDFFCGITEEIIENFDEFYCRILNILKEHTHKFCFFFINTLRNIVLMVAIWLRSYPICQYFLHLFMRASLYVNYIF